MKILVTDGNNRAALAITRSLGRKGHRIVVGERTQPSLAKTSRYCRESFVYPDPARDSLGFIETLLRNVRERGVDVILPVAEITTALVVEHKSAFEAYCRVPFSDAETFSRASNKVEVIRLAQGLGIPVPISVVLVRPGDRPPWPNDLRFPVVVKPHRSRIPMNKGWRSTSVTYAKTETELDAILAAKNAAEYPLLIQQRIAGPGMGVFMCYNRGTLAAVFGHRRLREKPPSGGVSVLCESVPVAPQSRAYAKALLDHLKWQGVAMVEFKLDQADQTPKLMEINGRFWGSLELAIIAGVDFPELLIRSLEDRPVQLVDSYRIGVKSRWLLGDLDVLLMTLFKDRDTLDLPPGHGGKIQSIIEFLNCWQNDLHYEVLSVSDMKPALFEAMMWLTRRSR
jgi:predicted ATP-grasp superfamily ATP-dependent carboligase